MTRRLILAFAALVLLSGCAAGTNAVTLKEYTPTDGNQVTSDSIKVRNLVLVAQTDGTANLVATIINVAESDDALESITVNGTPVVITADSLDLRYNAPLIFGGESANASGSVPLNGIRSGQFVSVNLTFANSGLIQTDALVREPILEFGS